MKNCNYVAVKKSKFHKVRGLLVKNGSNPNVLMQQLIFSTIFGSLEYILPLIQAHQLMI